MFVTIGPERVNTCSSIRNVQRTVRRICNFISGLKGLRSSCTRTTGNPHWSYSMKHLGVLQHHHYSTSGLKEMEKGFLPKDQHDSTDQGSNH